MDMRRDSRSSDDADPPSKTLSRSPQESSMDLFRRFSFKNLYQEDHEHLYGQEPLHAASPLTRDQSAADLDYGGVPQTLEDDEQTQRKHKIVKYGAIIIITIFLIASAIALVLSFKGLRKVNVVSDPFGRQLLPEFSFQEGYVSLNHGAYGAVPVSVLNSATSWTKYVEINPDRWYRYEKHGLQASAKARLASYVGVNTSDIIYIPGTSAALASIIRAIRPSGKNTILHFNLLQGSTRAVLNDASLASSTCPISTLQLNITFPTTSSEIVSALVATLNGASGASIFAVVLDHITSLPAIALPVDDIIEQCQARNVYVVVNGAHAVGQVPLNLYQLDPDFYIGNAQKWLFAPKGSTFLFAHPRVQSLLPSTIIRWNGDQQPMQTFERDFAPYLAISDALDFRARFGEQKIMAYTRTLAQTGGRRLANMWGTNVLAINDPSLIDLAMTNVRLPLSSIPETSMLTPNQLADAIFASYQTWVPIFEFNGDWYCRVSAQIYNQESDIIYYGNAMLTTLNQFNLI